MTWLVQPSLVNESFSDLVWPAYLVVADIAGWGKHQLTSSLETAMAKRSAAQASSETSKVKAVNLAYYKALSARDLGAMESIWTCAADNILIAPPVDPHSYVGWAAIKGYWEAYWPTFDQFSVSMQVKKVNITGPVAWVHGIETSRRRKKNGEMSNSRNFGTNIFVKRDGRWLMVFHQSAVIPKNLSSEGDARQE